MVTERLVKPELTPLLPNSSTVPLSVGASRSEEALSTSLFGRTTSSCSAASRTVPGARAKALVVLEILTSASDAMNMKASRSLEWLTSTDAQGLALYWALPLAERAFLGVRSG